MTPVYRFDPSRVPDWLYHVVEREGLIEFDPARLTGRQVKLLAMLTAIHDLEEDGLAEVEFDGGGEPVVRLTPEGLAVAQKIVKRGGDGGRPRRRSR
jgi:hypothetical protein